MTALYSLVQSGSTYSGTVSVALKLGTATTAGNSLIAGLVTTSTAAGSVTAPNANWRLAQASRIGGTGTGKAWIWYLEGKYNPGGATSFTFTGTAGDAMTGSVNEYSLPANYSLFFESTGIAAGGSGGITTATLPASAGNSADCLGIAVFGATFSAAQTGQSWNTITGWPKSGGVSDATLNYQMYHAADVAYSTGVSLAGGYSTATSVTGWAACLGLFRARVFTPDGLCGTERMTGCAIDPTGQMVIGTGDVEGMWRTADLGDHWQGTQNTLYNDGENNTAGATWSLLEPNTVYAGLGALGFAFAGFYASTDGGVTWTQRNGNLHYNSQNPVTPPSPASEGGGGDRAVSNHLFAQDTANSLIYSACYDSFQRSANLGTTWTDLSSSLPGTTANLWPRAVVNNPASQKEVYLACWDVGPGINGGAGGSTEVSGVYHTSDATVAPGSISWTQCTGYQGTTADLVVAGGWVYAACNKGGLYRAQLGTTVLHSLNGSGSAAFNGSGVLTGLPTGSGILYNGIDGYVDGAGNHQIFITVGGAGKPAAATYNPSVVQVTLPGGSTTGMTWTDCLNQSGGSVTVNSILPEYQGTYERKYWGAGLAYHNYLGGGSYDGGGRVCINQSDTNQIFMTGQGGIMRSGDGGVTWQNAVNGIVMMDFHNVAWDPVNANHWVAVSDDHPEMDVAGDWTGYTASDVTEQLAAGAGTECHNVAIDPVDGTVYVGSNQKYSSNAGGGVYARAWNKPSDATEIGYTAQVKGDTGNANACIGLYAGRDASSNYFVLALAQGAGLYRGTCPSGSDPTKTANWTWTSPAGAAANITKNGTIGQVNKFGAKNGTAATIYCFDKKSGVYRSTNYGVNTSGGSTWTLIYPKVISGSTEQAGDLGVNPDVAGEVWVTTSDTNGLRRLSGAATGIIGQSGGGTDTGISAPAVLQNPGSVDWWNGQPYVVTVAAGSTSPTLYTCTGDPTVSGNWSSIGGPEFQQYIANPGRVTAISPTGQIIICSPSNNSIIGTLGSGGTPPALIVQTTSLTAGQVGVAYSFGLSAFGGVRPWTWSQVAGTLPAGLSLDTNGSVTGTAGTIYGTPTTTGTATGLQFKVTDSATPTPSTATSVTMSLQVTAALLDITTTSLPAGALAVAYSQTLAAVNGTTPYTWALITGSLPTGLSLASSTGVISGTPTVAGLFSFTVGCTDSTTPTAETDQQPLTIDIPEPVITVTTTTLPAATAGMSYSATLARAGGVSPFTWAVIVIPLSPGVSPTGPLPAGFTLNASTGVLSGSSAVIGATPLTFQVTDSVGSQATALLTLIVAPPAAPEGVAALLMLTPDGVWAEPAPSSLSGSTWQPDSEWVISGGAWGGLSGIYGSGGYGAGTYGG